MSPSQKYTAARVSLRDSVALTVLCAFASIPNAALVSGPLKPPTLHESFHARTNRALIRSERVGHLSTSRLGPYNAQGPYDTRHL